MLIFLIYENKTIFSNMFSDIHSFNETDGLANLVKIDVMFEKSEKMFYIFNLYYGHLMGYKSIP